MLVQERVACDLLDSHPELGLCVVCMISLGMGVAD